MANFKDLIKRYCMSDVEHTWSIHNTLSSVLKFQKDVDEFISNLADLSIRIERRKTLIIVGRFHIHCYLDESCNKTVFSFRTEQDYTVGLLPLIVGKLVDGEFSYGKDFLELDHEEMVYLIEIISKGTKGKYRLIKSTT